jgi:hypothetical protein
VYLRLLSTAHSYSQSHRVDVVEVDPGKVKLGSELVDVVAVDAKSIDD